MEGLRESLLEEQKRLENIMKNTKNSLKDAPTGTYGTPATNHTG